MVNMRFIITELCVFSYRGNVFLENNVRGFGDAYLVIFNTETGLYRVWLFECHAVIVFSQNIFFVFVNHLLI